MELNQIVLNAKSKASIERSVGLLVEQISAMSATEVDEHIEKKIGKKLKIGFFPVRLIFMDEINKVLSRI